MEAEIEGRSKGRRIGQTDVRASSCSGLDRRLGGMLVLLVTDLKDFTGLVERLGDLEARAKIRHHNRLLRVHLARRDGVEVAHTGDGVIAAGP